MKSGVFVQTVISCPATDRKWRDVRSIKALQHGGSSMFDSALKRGLFSCVILQLGVLRGVFRMPSGVLDSVLVTVAFSRPHVHLGRTLSCHVVLCHIMPSGLMLLPT